MTDLRGRTFADLVAGLNAGQHLAVDALVAFVDGELGAVAHERAAQHVTACQACAADVAAQRQARSVVRSAGCPQVPAGLLATLRAIPDTTELPDVPDELAVTRDGTVVAFADSGRRPPTAPLGSTPPLGSGPRWGTGSSILGRRIGRTGAGAVVSGLVLGALIMTMFEDPVISSAAARPERYTAPALPAVVPSALPADEASVTIARDVTQLLRMAT